MIKTHTQRIRARQSWKNVDARSVVTLREKNKHYGRRWKAARIAYLSSPDTCLCRCCGLRGVIKSAEVVDHIIPWRWGQTEAIRNVLFWSTENWQPLCKACHDGLKKSQEQNWQSKRMTVSAIADVMGIPLDLSHG
ncbi:MAG: HNH endonuclease [Sedimentisphaerales bacterium]|nr:HNH endonuclease [Sedimentisphaerales bacterium]